MIFKPWILINLLLIFLIFFQMPKDTVGLTSFANRADFLGSPTIIDKLVKIFIGICVFGYVFIAFMLNKNV